MKKYFDINIICKCNLPLQFTWYVAESSVCRQQCLGLPSECLTACMTKLTVILQLETAVSKLPLVMVKAAAHATFKNWSTSTHVQGKGDYALHTAPCIRGKLKSKVSCYQGQISNPCYHQGLAHVHYLQCMDYCVFDHAPDEQVACGRDRSRRHSPCRIEDCSKYIRVQEMEVSFCKSFILKQSVSVRKLLTTWSRSR